MKVKTKEKKESKRDEFRKNKVSKHPAYIYKKVGNDYEFIGVTHSSITQKTKNIKLTKNPDPQDKRVAYFLPKANKEKTHKFSKKLEGWKLGKKDKHTAEKIKSNKK